MTMAYGIWLADGIAGKEIAEGTSVVGCRGKSISSLMVVDGDRLIKKMISRDPNRVHSTTLGVDEVLLEPIKNVVLQQLLCDR